jgi:ATP-dependent Clp protease ATP-binding subunit ClpA
LKELSLKIITKLEYSDEVIETAVNLSNKHITDRKLPDKAIDVMDEVGAYLRIKKKMPEDKPTQLNIKDIEKIVAKIARIPEKSSNEMRKISLKTSKETLSY